MGEVLFPQGVQQTTSLDIAQPEGYRPDIDYFGEFKVAISNKQRWIYVGELQLRCEKRRKNAPTTFSIDHLHKTLSAKEENGTHKKLTGNDDARMFWCSNVEKTNTNIRFLLHFGDKDVSDPAFVDFKTTETREEKKKADEGVPFSSHVVIRSSAEENGNYVILIERTTGIFMKSVENYLRWLLKDSAFKVDYLDEKKKPQSVFGVVEIFGYKSKLLKDVLKTGTIQDVEFLKEEEQDINGVDELPTKTNKVMSAKFQLQKKVNEEQGRNLFNYFTNWSKDHGYEEDSKMLVRIKTQFGQIKQTEVDPNGDVLDSFFVANEQVTGFKDALPQFHQKPIPEMFQKIEAIFEQY